VPRRRYACHLRRYINPRTVTFTFTESRVKLLSSSLINTHTACLLVNKLMSRYAMHKRGLCRRAVSVCLSVCLSAVCLSVSVSGTVIYSVETSRHNYSETFARRVATPFGFFCTKRYDNNPTERPLKGRRMQGKYEKSQFSTNISLES